MIQTLRTNFILILFGFAAGVYSAIAFGPKPEPKIEYIEKIVEVEKKTTTKRSVKAKLPSGVEVEVVDEISDFLKNVNKDSSTVKTPSSPRHQVLPIYSAKGSWGGQYLHNFTPSVVGGVGYKDGSFVTFGVQF